ncbi:MAG: hypothetical protein V4614_03585 [Pseudomonadota bacterium]
MPVSLAGGNIASMIRTSNLCPQQASLIAVSALDDLVTHLVKASQLKLSSRFLDWIADDATPYIEQQVHTLFSNPAFEKSLRHGDHRIALSRWVRHWICPHISRQFAQLAEHLPADVAAPAELKPMHDFKLPAYVAQPARPVRVASHPLAAAIQAAF